MFLVLFPATLRKQNRPLSRPSRSLSLLDGGETEETMIDKDLAAEAIRNIEDQFQKIDSASEWAAFYQVHTLHTHRTDLCPRLECRPLIELKFRTSRYSIVSTLRLQLFAQWRASR